jgi:MFS family permease
MSTFGHATRAFRSRNYRLFFAGQFVSLIGTWMTRVAASWLLYRLTKSAALLGLAGFASQLPSLIVGPFAGVWIDRWDRRRTVTLAQIGSMIQSLLLAALTLAGVINTAEIILLLFLQGLINAFEMPARQSFVVKMVDDPADLPNAIALNSSMVNGARLVGPAIAGLMIAGIGEGYCFLLDGISYFAVIAGLMAMRVAPFQPPAGARRNTLTELREGFRYAWGSSAIRPILINLGQISLLVMPYTILLPVFASDVFHGGPRLLGWLSAASGVGALMGALHLAANRNTEGLARRIGICTVLFGAAMIGMGESRWLWLTLGMVGLGALGFMQQMAASNTILQTIVEDDKRGRVMAFYFVALQGLGPFGSLMAGSLASRIGAPETVAVSGVLALVGGIWFMAKLPMIRRSVAGESACLT